MFKSVDKKLEEIGFMLVQDCDTHVHYERRDTKFNFTHTVMLTYKNNGKHILQSYDENLMDSKGIGNTCVGLTYSETKLFMKKMKKKGWIDKK
mgnify:CR=1 FL=1